MSCRRAFEIDLPACFAEPARPEHADFRAHYPLCAECAAEVAAWTELEASLHGLGAGHPEPAALLSFEERAADLAAPERARIEAHLAGCASCRDELRSLRAFPFEDTGAKHGRARRSRPPERRSRIGRVHAVVLHPAFAYAVVALLAWPAAQSLLAPATRDAVVAPPAASTAPSSDVALFDELGKREKLVGEAVAQPELARSASEAPSVVTAAKPAVVPVARRDAPAAPPAEPSSVRSLEAEAPTQGPATTVETQTLEATRLSILRKERGAAYGLAESSAPEERASRVLEAARARAGGVTALREADAASAPARLKIELPPELRAERELLVRVRDAAHLRELRERVQPTAGAEWIELELPEDWPTGIGLEIELRAASQRGEAERVFRQTLTR